LIDRIPAFVLVLPRNSAPKAMTPGYSAAAAVLGQTKKEGEQL